MHPHDQRIRIASALNRAQQDLLEASERASDLKLFEVSGQLLDLSLDLCKLSAQFLELETKPALKQQSLDLPF